MWFLGQQRQADAALRHRSGEEQRTAGDDLFGLADVRNDLFGGWRVQALTPASASDAPMSLRNCGGRPGR
jgi:hypothetical protein